MRVTFPAGEPSVIGAFLLNATSFCGGAGRVRDSALPS